MYHNKNLDGTAFMGIHVFLRHAPPACVSYCRYGQSATTYTVTVDTQHHLVLELKVAQNLPVTLW